MHMKKYLLNYMVVGAMALFTVVGLQSFTTPSNQQDQAELEDMIWFLSEDDNVDCVNSTFEPLGTENRPALCEETHTRCCAIGYPRENCSPTTEDPDLWQVDNPTGGVTIKFQE